MASCIKVDNIHYKRISSKNIMKDIYNDKIKMLRKKSRSCKYCFDKENLTYLKNFNYYLCKLCLEEKNNNKVF